MTIAFMTTVTVASNAQTLEKSKITDNISVVVKGGATTPLNNPVDMDGVRGVFGVELRKEITPILGLGVEGEWTVNTSQWPSQIPSDFMVDHQYVGAFSTTNWMNLLGGFKGKPRTFEIETVVGVGWGHTFASVEDATHNLVMTKTGMNLNFNLGSKKDWSIGIKPAVVWNMNQDAWNSNYNVNRAALQLQASVAYRFSHFNVCNRVATQDEVDAMNAKINALRKELEECQSRPVEVKEVIVEKTVVIEKEKEVAAMTPIQFLQNSNTVSETSTVALYTMAEEMKQTGKTYTLVGFASEEGPEVFNQKLSEKRATIVKEKLVELGVEADKLITVGKGATTQFGEKREFNRVVVIEK